MLYLSDEGEFRFTNKFQALYFYSMHFQFHRKLILMIDKIETKLPYLDFLAIDIDYFKTFKKRFSLLSIPTIIIFNNSKEIYRASDQLMLSDLVTIFGDICNLETNTYGENLCQKKTTQKNKL